MPKTAYTRRQDHGTRGTFRDRVLDWQTTSEVSASNHLVVALSDLGIKNLRPTKKELTKAANKLLELAIAEPVPTTAYDPDYFEAFANKDGDTQNLPGEYYLPTDTDFGFRSGYQIRTADNGMIGDPDHLLEDDPFNGSDRPMSGFHFFTL